MGRHAVVIRVDGTRETKVKNFGDAVRSHNYVFRLEVAVNQCLVDAFAGWKPAIQQAQRPALLPIV
jgi:hypothetical protein